MPHVIALIHEEAGSFGISFPDFPGCISTAGTLDEAVQRGAQALAFHLEGMVEDGEAIPQPRSLAVLRADPGFAEDFADAIVAAVPIELPGKAVRVNITMDEHLLQAVDRAAAAAGATRSGYLAEAARVKLGVR
jgi:predicted RNase H-like HicB family nuclease